MSAPHQGYRVVVEELPALGDGKKLRRIATVAVDDGFDDTFAHAFEHGDGTWVFNLGLLAEQHIEMYDLPPLSANSERAARQWVEAVARMCLRESAS